MDARDTARPTEGEAGIQPRLRTTSRVRQADRGQYGRRTMALEYTRFAAQALVRVRSRGITDAIVQPPAARTGWDRRRIGSTSTPNGESEQRQRPEVKASGERPASPNV